MSKSIAVLIGLFPLLVQAGTGYAQDRSGFWLRFNLGAGYAKISSDETAFGDFKLTGDPFAGVGSVALGAFLNDRLVLFGEVAVDVLSDPKVTIGGEEQGAAEGFTATAGGLGAGVQYYLTRTWFLAGGVYLSEVTFEFENTEVSTDPAFGLRLLIGKDWPVSNVIALGVAADGLLVLGATDAADDTWNSFGFGVTFSFTWAPKGVR